MDTFYRLLLQPVLILLNAFLPRQKLQSYKLVLIIHYNNSAYSVLKRFAATFSCSRVYRQMKRPGFCRYGKIPVVYIEVQLLNHVLVACMRNFHFRFGKRNVSFERIIFSCSVDSGKLRRQNEFLAFPRSVFFVSVRKVRIIVDVNQVERGDFYARKASEINFSLVAGKAFLYLYLRPLFSNFPHVLRNNFADDCTSGKPPELSRLRLYDRNCGIPKP